MRRLDAAARGPWTRAAGLFVRGHRSRPRVFFWSSVVLLSIFYVGMALSLAAGTRTLYAWSTFCVAAAPFWPSLYVLWSCSQFFPLEHERNTLEALRLTPLPLEDLCHAMVISRLREGALFLLACAPLYMAPHCALEGMRDNALMTNIGLCSTFWRPLIGVLALGAMTDTGEPMAGAWLSLVTGPVALIVDCTRLYALGAIGTIISLRVSTQTRALIATLFWTGVFAMIVGCSEWLGGMLTVGIAFMADSPELAYLLLPLEVLVFEAWLGNVYVPRYMLQGESSLAEWRLGVD